MRFAVFLWEEKLLISTGWNRFENEDAATMDALMPEKNFKI